MAERRKKKRKRSAAPPAPETEERKESRGILRGMARLFGPPVASALLLTLALPPTELSWLAYLAPVPLLVAAVRARVNRDAFWAAFVGGLAFFGINLYWVLPVTTAGYLALIPYVALYWAVFAWLLRRIARATPVPLSLAAPAVWVTLEFVRGWLISGLPWIYVGHTQYENLVLIQTADTLGVYGASFLCLMTAGLVADALVRPIFVPGNGNRPTRLSRLLLASVLVTAAAWAGTIGYGLWRLGQETTRPGPVVASVQTRVPQDIKRKVRHESIAELELRMLRDQFDLTDEALAKAKQQDLAVDLVVWPETMVPGIMSRSFLEDDLEARFDNPDMRATFQVLQRRCRSYWSMIRAKAQEVGAPILFGGHDMAFEGGIALPGGGYVTRGPRYNSALLVSPGSKPYAADHSYAKVHLVPFGEFLPLKSWPWLYERLQSFTPWGYDYSLTAGDPGQAPFVLAYDGREARFQVPICYEDAMAYRCRDMVRPADPTGPKAVDFLVNISNDGWFKGSIELDQHLNLCVFRAVENRVGIVRSVNTGISALIEPTGRIDDFVVDEHGQRRDVSGSLAGRLVLDDRVAPYTLIGDVFAKSCVLATAGLVFATVISHLFQRKETAA